MPTTSRGAWSQGDDTLLRHLLERCLWFVERCQYASVPMPDYLLSRLSYGRRDIERHGGQIGPLRMEVIDPLLCIESSLIPLDRWLFFLEGSITIFLAIFGMFILPDFPSNSSSWLTPAEKAVAEQRMEEEARGHQKSVGYMQGFILAISDWKVWWLSTIMGLIQLSLSFMTFFPTLTATLGYNLMTTLLLCAPPWVLTTISAFLVTRCVKSFNHRFPY